MDAKDSPLDSVEPLEKVNLGYEKDRALAINQMLKSFGFTEELEIESVEGCEREKIINCIQFLVQQRSREALVGEELNDHIAKLEGEVRRLKDRKALLERDLDDKEQNDLVTKTNSLKESIQRLRIETKRLEKENSRLQHLDTGYRATLRRKEMEYERLQKRYNDHLQRQFQGQKRHRGIDIAANLKPSETKSSKMLPRTSNEEAFASMIMANYEAKQQELMHENADLRASLKSISGELGKVCRLYNKATKLLKQRYEARNEADEFSHILPIKEGSFDGELFQLPSQWVKTGVEKLMREQMEELRTKLEILSRVGGDGDSKDTDYAEEATRLRERLQEAKAIIAEQDKLLQIALADSTKGRLVNAESGVIDLEDQEFLRDQIRRDRCELDKRAAQMNREREMLSDAAKRLEEDRNNFEMARMSALEHSPTRVVGSAGTMKEDRGQSPRTIKLSEPATPATRNILREIGVEVPELEGHNMLPSAF